LRWTDFSPFFSTHLPPTAQRTVKGSNDSHNRRNMTQHRETRIAHGLRGGDANAWYELYDAHAERVWRLVARLMEPGSTEVADVVQETFLAAAESARRFDPERGSLAMWLSGIARNQVALHYRGKAKAVVVGTASGDDRAADAGPMTREPGPDEALVCVELAGQVRVALTELPIDYEQLLTAKYAEGATLEQIATAHQSTFEAIRSKLARARRAFRRIFSDRFPDSVDTATGGRHEP
jgi:RNA polymerase sigma-70 factor (ECF subfamily)